jgi:transposase
MIKAPAFFVIMVLVEGIQISAEHGRVLQDTEITSRLLGLEGVKVVEVDAEADGGVTVWVVTSDPLAALCPGCGVAAGVKEQVTVAPADVDPGCGRARVVWVKRRRECRDPSCRVGTFTESLPQVPPRCRLTTRLRARAGRLVAEQGLSVEQAARACGLSWPTVHGAFADQMDPLLEAPLGAVEWLGIDTVDDAAYWLAQQRPAWRHAVSIVAIDMCGIYASAVRRMLPHAQLVVDLFHVVQLATKMVGDVRRRTIRDKYGRRGRSGDAEYGLKNLLVRNLEHLRPDQFDKIIDVLGADRYGQQIAAAWIAKEKLRDVLNLRARLTGSTPPERQVRDALARFYTWCADHDDIAELVTLANTISRWENEIVAAILTGVTNARSEGLNRVAKLEARNAYGFRNPANQRRRVRTACTRNGHREAASRTATTPRSPTVIKRNHDPG